MEGDIYCELNKAEIYQVKDVDDNILIEFPKIDKCIWEKEADEIRKCEQDVFRILPKERWISMRLDLKGFSKIGPKLFNGKKYNDRFAEAMVSTLKLLMFEFNAQFGFTQSDEITLLISSSRSKKNRDIYSEHPYAGKRDKLVSLAASFGSVALFQELLKVEEFKKIPLIQFDCRAGSWLDAKDAFRLIMWRSYDCTVNGVSDAIFKNNIEQKKKNMRLSTLKKIRILNENNLLPLTNHQCYGTLLQKSTKNISAIDVQSGLPVSVTRRCLVSIPGNLLINVKKSVIKIGQNGE